MSEQKSKPVTAKNSIVKAIMAFFKLGEAGKLDSFFNRIVKASNRKIEGLKKNIEAHKYNLKTEISSLTDELEDAEMEVQEAFLNVPLDSINTNADQVDYMETYLYRLDRAKSKVTRIEEKMEGKRNTVGETVKKIKAVIKDIEATIETITNYAQ